MVFLDTIYFVEVSKSIPLRTADAERLKDPAAAAESGQRPALSESFSDRILKGGTRQTELKCSSM